MMFGKRTISAWWRMIWPWSNLRKTDVTSPIMNEDRIFKNTYRDNSEIRPHIMTEIIRSKQQVTRKVQDMKSQTEHEVLSCGNVLLNIVDNVQSLISETDDIVDASVQRSDQVTSNFIHDMQQDIQTQEKAIGEVLHLADSIKDTITLISRLTEFTKIIAVNSKIEAARLGEQGKGFMIIADHIRELGDTIQETVDTVSTTIGAVHTSLPPVMACTLSMQERTKSFTEMVDEHMKAAILQKNTSVSSNQHLVSLCNEALSHLQFQDSLSQKLSSLNGDMDLVEERISRILAGETQLEAIEDIAEVVEEQALSGEIILF